MEPWKDAFSKVMTELLWIYHKSNYRGHPLYYWRAIKWSLIRCEEVDEPPSSCHCCESGFESDDTIWDYALN